MNIAGKWSSRIAASLLVAPMLVTSAVGIRSVSATPTAQPDAAQTFNALIGNEIFTEEGEKSSWQADRFYPENVTINVGDSINWKHDGGVDPHTLTFLGADSKFPQVFIPPAGPGEGGPPNIEINPQVAFATGGNTYDGTTYLNSGIIASDVPGPKEFKVTFSKAGTYKFVCLIHSAQLPDGTIVGMQGQLTVQDAGSALAKNPDAVLAEADAMATADEQAAMAAEPEAKRVAVSSKPGPNGTTIYRINTGYQLPAGTLGATLEYMRFSPKEINISVGDSLEWGSPTPRGFHDVIFGDEPEAILIEPQAAGPPKVSVNGLAAFPVGPSVHSGTGLYTSGDIIGPEDADRPGAVKSYSLTFSQPGRFEYICAYHYSNGMDGSVIVASRTGGTGDGGSDGGENVPGMPTTGNSDSAMLLLALLLSSLLLVSAGVGLRARKAAK